MKFKKILLGVVALGAVVSLAACSSNSSSKSPVQAIKDKGQLTVATSADYPPFEYQAVVNGKNTYVGIDIDIAKQVAKDMGVKLNISNMSFDNVLGAVSTGKADIAIAGITETTEREKSFDFSDAYYQDVNLVIIQKANLDKYTSASDFKGQSVIAQTGSTQVNAVQDQMKGANLVQLTNGADEINEVKAGKAAACVMDSMVAKSYVAENPDLTIAKVSLPQLPDDFGKSIAIKKGSTALQKQINETISKMKKDGQLQKIIDEDYAASQKAGN